MSILPKFYKDAVVSIGVRVNNNISWIGTGFFLVKMINPENAIPFLITNRHVLEGQKSIVIRMKEKNLETLKIVDVPLYIEESATYKFHAKDNIDIAVIRLNGNFINSNNLEFPAFDIDKHAYSSDLFREQGVEEGNMIYMLGFPMGMVIDESSSPICRLGCIARMSKAQISGNYNILVDIQNFPGNSGSPIVTRPEIISIDGTKSLNQCALLGIIHSYIPYQESLINVQTKKIVELRSENSGLAYVHPVEYIQEIIDYFLIYEV